MSNDGENVLKRNSEAIVADLLNDLKSSDKPFSVDKLAACADSESVREKKKKRHKHRSSHRSKKSKKERRRSRTWSSSRSRSRSRNRSKERKKSRKRKSRSRSCSGHKEEKVKIKENESQAKPSSSHDEMQLHDEDQEETVKMLSEFVEPSKKDPLECFPDNGIIRDPIIKKEKKLEITISKTIPKAEECSSKKEQEVEDGEIEDIAYGPPESITEDTKNYIEDKGETKGKREKEVKEGKEKKKKKEKIERKRKRSPSYHDNGKLDRRSARRSRSKDRTSHRTPERVKEDAPLRRRSESRGRRARSHDRPTRWRSRSRERRDYDEYRRKRSRSREVIDKEKLLAIAKTKRAEMMSNGDRDNASIEDFVTYCKKLQKRQEREKRREAGQAVSDHESDGETVRYKHPYAMPKDPIRINIVTATSVSLAQKALTGPEEPAQLGASQLRIVYPVSSGAVHKENAEWIPVEKEDVPKSCSVEQKKHVALTSLEIDRCRAQGIPVAPVPVPKFLNSILPPPPMPPQFLPNPGDPFRPPTPPSLPSVLYVPSKEKMILKEPKDIQIPAPSDIGKVLKQRTEAQRKVLATPNDFDAHRALREANEQISLWAALKSLPGEYTGTTGLRLLSADQLQPHNPKYHAWVKKDQFRNAAPATTGIGRMMLEKMGWRPGEGLGRDATGNVEPLVLDVKSDRKGLMAEEEMSTKQRNKANAQNNVPVDLSSKNPISLIMELCAKRRWNPPSFTCEESGADHMKMFIWTVTLNKVEYRPMCGSKQKKEGKAVAAQVALQSLGVLPRDPDLPVYM